MILVLHTIYLFNFLNKKGCSEEQPFLIERREDLEDHYRTGFDTVTVKIQ